MHKCTTIRHFLFVFLAIIVHYCVQLTDHTAFITACTYCHLLYGKHCWNLVAQTQKIVECKFDLFTQTHILMAECNFCTIFAQCWGLLATFAFRQASVNNTALKVATKKHNKI